MCRGTCGNFRRILIKIRQGEQGKISEISTLFKTSRGLGHLKKNEEKLQNIVHGQSIHNGSTNTIHMHVVCDQFNLICYFPFSGNDTGFLDLHYSVGYYKSLYT